MYGSKSKKRPRRGDQGTSMPKKSGLTERQEQTIRKHSKHHTPGHMKFMRKAMMEGKTFTAAHKAAMKKVGK